MRPWHLKKRCQKHVIFWHRLFRAHASILEGLGLPSLSQIRRLGLPGRSQKPPKIESFGYMCPRCFPRGSKVAPKGFQGSLEIDFGRIFDRFGSLFSLFLAVKINYLNRNFRYHMYLLSDTITWTVRTSIQSLSHMSKEGRRYVRSTKNLTRKLILRSVWP